MIGIILKNARIQRGFSQEELGNKLSLARNTISSYERGNSQPDFDTVIKILNICGYELQLKDIQNNNIIDINKFSREI